MAITDGKPYNHYVCQVCGRTTVTFHEDDGVTPFMLSCHATEGCTGTAFSLGYICDQSPNQIPHVIWWRAKDYHTLNKAVQRFPPGQTRSWMREHHAAGGCLMRVNDERKPQPKDASHHAE